ncbi:MAG: hypothetical protein Q4E31_09580 [Intestinibacter bartlettii]|uniref:hypothetical protein n=1 Tax=Intestinibacter bartlettii TaxID=261299 RepID=UPI0026EFF1EE|nr:hypothetical protein [Intestinibacter bartlettii]MDO5011062.1 hypothetical protein [Intestinibacter bartlettii]
MNNKKLKLTLVLSVFSLIFLTIFIIFKFNQSKEEKQIEVNDSQAKVLEIENTKITGISHTKTKTSVTTKIKNKSQNILSNIRINYIELDKNQNKISTKQIPVEVSLKKDEKALITILPQNYTYTIDIIGYSYETKNYDINVNLDENNITVGEISQIENTKEQLDDIIKYDILQIYDLQQLDDKNYKVKIKNNSQKNLGNIILKVAEKNKEDEYVSISKISYNSTLKAKEFSKLILNSQDKENTLEIIGYTYDDIENKSNIDVDFKTNSASIIRN